MRPSRPGLLLFTAALLASATGASAQSPLPYGDYRAAIEAHRDEESRLQKDTPPPTSVQDVVDSLNGLLERSAVELARLEAITPEPCYSDAHTEYVAYGRDVIATYRDTIPLVLKADSIMGMLPMLLAANTTIRTGHPLAYVEDKTTMDGFRSEPLHILDVLATCAGFPSPSPSVTPSSASTSRAPETGVVFTDSGNGTKATAPFQLVAGDHELTYEVSTPESYCSFGLGLAATDGSYSTSIGNNAAYVYADAGPYRNTTWFSVPADGRFYLDVSGDCRWTARLAATRSPLDGADPLAISGSGLGLSPAFTLAGGDYVVRYHLASPASEQDCDVYAGGLVDPVSPYSDLGGDIQLTMDAASELDGETYLYGIEPGRYQYNVGNAWCQFGVAEPVTWEITIEPLG